MYYSHFKSSHWGLDQNSLINLFVRDQNWISNCFLDSPINSDSHKIGNCLIPATSLNESFYRQNVKIDDIPSEVLDILNVETKWAGEPTNLRGDKLRNLLNMDIHKFNLMRDIIESDDELKNFYYNV